MFFLYIFTFLVFPYLSVLSCCSTNAAPDRSCSSYVKPSGPPPQPVGCISAPSQSLSPACLSFLAETLGLGRSHRRSQAGWGTTWKFLAPRCPNLAVFPKAVLQPSSSLLADEIRRNFKKTFMQIPQWVDYRSIYVSLCTAVFIYLLFYIVL